MSPTKSDTSSHIGRRRHASQTAPNPNWVRRAGIAGGVIGTLALTGMSAPANADAAAATDDTATTGSIPVLPLSTATTAEQAVDALDQTALDLQVRAEKDAAYNTALKQAEKARLQADRKAAAAKAAAKARAAATASRSADRTSLSSASGSIATVISFLQAQVGKPYVYGASGPGSYDCSGLTQAAYRAAGVTIGRTTWDQYDDGVHVSQSELRPGDLVFFYSDLHHVGMYVGNGLMLHAPHTGDFVKIAPMGDRPFAGGVRIA